MKVSEIIKEKVGYFYFEIDQSVYYAAGLNVPAKYGYFRMLNHRYTLNQFSGYFLVGLYDLFTKSPITEIDVIKRSDWVYNQRLCLRPKLRGEGRAYFIDSEAYKNISLPHFTGLNFKHPRIKEYGYYEMNTIAGTYEAGKENVTKFEDIRHLSTTTIHDFEWLKTLLYIEYLKREKPNLSDSELLRYWLILDTQNDYEKMSEDEKRHYFFYFKKDYNTIPYRDVPNKYHEKAKCHVDGTTNEGFKKE